MPNDRKFDLEERTAQFGILVIKFCKKVKRSPISDPLINQLIRSATSVGANYCEADDAESRMDFKHKISLCKKEAHETKHWLRMLATAIPEEKDELKNLWKEAKELNLIFNAIVRSTKNNTV